MPWEIIHSDRAAVTELGRYPSWEAGANALYAFCDAWGRHGAGPNGRKRRPRESIVLVRRNTAPLGEPDNGAMVSLVRCNA